MSLEETRQLFGMLAEINEMLEKITVKTRSLRAEAAHAHGQWREFEYLLFRTLSILRRMGLPEDVAKAASQIQRLILIIRMLHSIMMMISRTTWYGWALGLITTLGMGIVAGDLAMDAETR